MDAEQPQKPLVEDLADVLVRMVVGWEYEFGFDLAKHPDVVRVMARYREEHVAGPGVTREEWAVRVDRPHPRRKEEVGDYIRLADRRVAEYGPRIWDGWMPVSRTIHIGPWRPLDTEEMKP
jgi:hypothetical protein